MSATTISWPLEERHAYLEKEYQELEEQYRLVIDRVEIYPSSLQDIYILHREGAQIPTVIWSSNE
jgi:hypothetical protein